eukprot:jgi/Psemu1/298797/fgenesh1_pm.754_\
MSNNNHNDDSFELQAKADEWMEITPKEELLRAELDRLREAFSKCSAQLERSRLENDLLKDTVVSLETQASALESSLAIETEGRSAARTELAHRDARIASLAKALDESSKALATQRSERDTESRELTEALSEARQSTDRLERELSVAATRSEHERRRWHRELETATNDVATHKTAAVRFASDLRTVREKHEQTQRALDSARNDARIQTELRERAERNTQTIAVLAETLKSDKARLEGRVAAAEKTCEEARAVANADTSSLKERLALAQQRSAEHIESLRSELAERLEDLSALGRSHEQLQLEFQTARQTIRETAVETASLRAHLSAMETGRHELLEHQSELEENLEDVHDSLERAHREVHTTREQLDDALAETALLRSNHCEREHNHSASIDRLEKQLEEQRLAFEDKLAQIHSILGLSFAKAVRSEVRTLKRSALEQLMPAATRVPLLLAAASAASADNNSNSNNKNNTHRSPPSSKK